MNIEWLRDVSPVPDDAGREALAGSIRDEISASGPITFARFMQRALYDPAQGYYTLSVSRPTGAGDFVTAPELHPIYGETLARQIDEMWRRLERPQEFVVREYGAGSAALFLAIVDGLVRLDSPLAGIVRYQPVDFARQRAAITENMRAVGRDDQLMKITESAPAVGVVIANEYVDALPMHRVIVMNGELREIHVDWRDDAFTEVAGPVTDPRIKTWFADSGMRPGVDLEEGQRAEVNLAMLDWVSRVADDVERGYVVVIDYGSSARELYGASRPNGTIRAFARQRVSADVLAGVGERDITAHVDFDALERAARASGFEVVGRRRAAEFVLAVGLEEVYAQARREAERDWESALTLRSAVQRLIDPNALGGYQVAVFAKGVALDSSLLGFAPLDSSPPR